jgi:DNA (cytosine-5)-methyltransferase 1
MKLRTLDLFSGIGGFSLGLESTGFFETIGFVEKDKFCQKVLKKHWSNINIEEDIRNVKGEKYQADVVTGGFPCQPFSVAGKRKSTADDRYLWDEMLRVIRETKPRWVIGENVEGIVNINEGMVLRQVLNDLENEGFKSQCIIIPASGIGAWHQRKRIWILGYSNNNGSYRSQGNATKQSSNEQEDRLSFGDDKNVSNTNAGFSIRENEEIQTGWDAINSSSSNASNSNSQRTQVQTEGKHSSIKMSRSSGEKTWWEIESTLCGVPHGLSYELDKDRSNRIRALGNSIVPQIARQIGLSIMEAELNG